MPAWLFVLVVGGWLTYRLTRKFRAHLVYDRSRGWCRLLAVGGFVYAIPLLTHGWWALPLVVLAVEAALATGDLDHLVDAAHAVRQRIVRRRRRRTPVPNNVIPLRSA